MNILGETFYLDWGDSQKLDAWLSPLTGRNRTKHLDKKNIRSYYMGVR